MSPTQRPAKDDSTRIKPASPTLLGRIQKTLQDWRYPSHEKRDLRLDLLRGFAVLVMVVDHFGGASWLYLITGNNNFFTSGAEAFVLISGMVVGIVYGGIATREGLHSATKKALQRALTLYKLTVVLTLLFAALSDWFQLPWAKGIDISSPLWFVFDVVLLRQTYYLADIPLMYTILMAVAPIGLFFLHKRLTGWLVAGSFMVWAGFQIVNYDQILIMPIVGNTTFHPAAWQLIFFWAMAFGYHREAIYARLRRLPRWGYFAVSALLFVALLHLYSEEIQEWAALYPAVDVKGIVAALFNKSTVAPGRIAATVIVFQFAYLFVTVFWKPVLAAFGWLFVPLGQNSLYGYTMHVVIIGLFYAALPYLPGHITERGIINTSLQLGVLLVLWLMIRKQLAFGIVPR